MTNEIFDRDLDSQRTFLVEVSVSRGNDLTVIVLADNFTHAANKVEKVLKETMLETVKGEEISILHPLMEIKNIRDFPVWKIL